jgi:hypothetical protein
MKNKIRSLMFLAVAFLTCTVLTSDVAAQCVRCRPSGSCFICSASSSGGCDCLPAGCKDCITSTPCAGPGICSPGQRAARINVDETTILEIAQDHPRFAVALAMIRRVGGIQDWAEFKSFPADLDATQVHHWLKVSQPNLPEETATFFKEYQKRTTRSEPMNIEFNVTRVNDKSFIIRGNIVNPYTGDPPATQIEIEIVNDKVAKWKVY